MKRIVILLCVFLYTFAINAQKNISREEAWSFVKTQLLKSDTSRISAYSPSGIVKANSIINSNGDMEESPNYDSWFFFIDDNPLANWSHSCRYIYVSNEDLTYHVSYRQAPPLIDDMSILIKYAPVVKSNAKFRIPSRSNTRGNIPGSSKNYAVIISGGIDEVSNYERYWNDCSAMYSTLVNIYGYDKDKIYVLMSDGTDPAYDRNLISGGYDSSPLDLDGDGLSDIQYAATRTNIFSVFSQLSTILDNDDNLFIFTTDHGGWDSGLSTYMCLWNNELLYDYELSALVDSLNVGTVNICMEQCHSGGFIDNFTGNNHIIATACKYDESSYARPNLVYDEFIYHWVSAVSGSTPEGTPVNADTDNDGIVSMQEAFQYAESQDTRTETPQYASLPSDFGDGIGLHHFYFSGPSIPENPSVYQIVNLPPGCTVSWSYSGNTLNSATMTVNSPAQNQCTIDNTNKQYIKGTLTAAISKNGVTLVTQSKDIDTGADFSGKYSQDSYYYTDLNWHYYGKSPTTFHSGDHFSLYKGPRITLTSNKFTGANISYLTGAVYGWSHNNNTVSFYFPYYPNNPNSPAATTITVTYPNNYKVYQFSIMGKKPIGIVHPQDKGGISLASIGDGKYVVTVSATEENTSVCDEQTTWNLSVTNSLTGEVVLSDRVIGDSYVVDTDGWKQGIYIIQVLHNKETYTQKLNIK